MALVRQVWHVRDMVSDDIITVDPDYRSGEPCIRRHRITVSEVLGYLAGGESFDEIIDAFPQLTREDILACLAYASRALQIPNERAA